MARETGTRCDVCGTFQIDGKYRIPQSKEEDAIFHVALEHRVPTGYSDVDQIAVKEFYLCSECGKKLGAAFKAAFPEVKIPVTTRGL